MVMVVFTYGVGWPLRAMPEGGFDPPASSLELRLVGAVMHQLMDSLAGVLVEFAAATVDGLEAERVLSREAELSDQLGVSGEGEGEIEHGWFPLVSGGVSPMSLR